MKENLGVNKVLNKIFGEENEYDPLAGFHIVHDLYAELIKQGCELRDLFDYSCKELLFILKYKREGIAYKIWRVGSMTRAAFGAKIYPTKVEEAIPEMFEKKKGVTMPEWLREDYEKRINKSVKRSPDSYFNKGL